MGTNKLFIKLILLFTFLYSVIFGVIILTLYKTPQNSLWIKNCYLLKDKYAKTINVPKIVVASGSNALYGINTIDIEKELKIPTVNMAIHAGLQTDYILYRTKKILNTGDTVIIPFEYENYIWDGEQSTIKSDYILTHDKIYFNNMNIFEKLSMIYSINVRDLERSIWQQIKAPNTVRISKGYNANTLNINGDETYKNGNNSKFSNIPYKPFKLIGFKETKGLLKIKEFSNWCKKQKIKLYITYPNTVNYKVYLKSPYQNYFKLLKAYFNKNDISIIGSPYDAMYPLKYFYDTNYHMNKEGSQIRTKKLIEEIKLRIL